MKDIEVTMSKRKSTNFVLSLDDVLNNIKIGWQRKMVKTMKLVIILMNYVVKKKKLILTQVRGA